MRGRPTWGLSVWGGFLCALFALSSALHGSLLASAVMIAGALILFAWALWLASSER
jgi:Flp pilus assembly protein TadB